jgi:protoporphyrinogen oxidase
MARKIAIIGGGPGGLMTAYQLQQRCLVPFETTIYEATSRLGGKIVTAAFASASVAYEAGAAELYDYSELGEDPLRQLIARLGLKTLPMAGRSVVLDGRMLADIDEVGRIFGEPTRKALHDFDTHARQWMSPAEYYDSDWNEASAGPSTTFEAELDQVPDEVARRYLRALVHSDLATEPHRTSAAYGLQNYLMNYPEYMRLYTIEGGIERLPQELAARVDARILLDEPVLRVERDVRADHSHQDTFRVTSRRNGASITENYDFVVVALPNDCLPTIEFRGDALDRAMHGHIARHDHPAHYLRVSVLFREIFWQDFLKESYTMLDAFGGCCLYDESSRNGCLSHGVLSWLLAGEAATRTSNCSDAELVELVLDSLPASLQQGRALALEGRVHRWIGAVNGQPAGTSGMDIESRHVPQAGQHDLFVVGDYLFDSTINGVLDSADYVAEFLAEEIEASVEMAAVQIAAVQAVGGRISLTIPAIAGAAR